ncbi:hypothetical protein [Burkholderia ambifaria]|uniref:glycine-rich domain-containing protein n=1 Tax=Burkholderia ambifaria TaxID=152480 RepID=UPI001B8EEBDE|nr:hypothetical protein [Burkholderia ambifaria]MBR7929380.1 hypothetical protein [Burkholderia ambifaria]
MKRFLIALIAGAISVASAAATYVPVQLLNPLGSTSGQAIVSTGASSSPAWSSIVDSVVAGSGVAVSGATGNVTVSVATNGVGLGQIAQQAANSVLANATSSTGNVTAFTMPICSSSANALQWASGSGFACNSSINAASLGGTAAASYALLASPSLTGTPTAPTATTGTNTTQLATTAFVNSSITAATGRLLNVQVFSTPGSYTYTQTTGTTRVLVRVQGAGGGGGGCSPTSSSQASVGGPGAAGGYSESYITSGYNGVTVTVGAAGTAGAVSSNGGNGGGSSFGSLVTANGGSGGAAGAASSAPYSVAGSAGGSASGGSLLNVSGGGSSPTAVASTAIVSSLPGTYSPLGAGATARVTTTTVAGTAATGYGAGGSGCANAASQASGNTGGAGSGGIVAVYELN